jgi:hypothetical protein
MKTFISSDMMIDGVNLFIVEDFNDQRRLMQMNGAVVNWVLVEDGVYQSPTISLSNDAGRAVLETLLRHYQGASDMHTVRSDLLHERGRVDRLMDVLIGNSRQLGDVADKLAEC